MSLPAFASLDDFGTRLPGGLADADVARAQAALDDASSEIRSVAGRVWETVPTDPEWAADALMRICCAAARRSFTNPDGVTQESLGSYSVSQSDSSSDVYLTSAEKRTIERIIGGTSGIFAIDTAPAITDSHAEVCSLRFGALYCSCGADLTLGFPLYEMP